MGISSCYFWGAGRVQRQIVADGDLEEAWLSARRGGGSGIGYRLHGSVSLYVLCQFTF